MSFICDNCGKVVASGTPMHKIVTQTRQVAYSNGGKGTEIVSEKGVCLKCRDIMPEPIMIAGIVQVNTPSPPKKYEDWKNKRRDNE
jgi:hypothetical protein